MNSEIIVRTYVTADGAEPFADWLTRLKDLNAIAAVDKRIARVRLGNLGDHKHIDGGVYELRIHHGPGYRVYFGKEEQAIVILLCGGDKGSQQRDIVKAKRYWTDYGREDNANKEL